jgi:hypothetical protein
MQIGMQVNTAADCDSHLSLGGEYSTPNGRSIRTECCWYCELSLLHLDSGDHASCVLEPLEAEHRLESERQSSVALLNDIV